MPFKDSLGAATEAVSAICDLQPLTEYTLQFRRQELRSVVGIMGISGDSGSTPTPSANVDPCAQQTSLQTTSQQNGGGDADRTTQSDSDANKRSLVDGPTTRQKILVASIWIFSAIFALATCFPDKIFGVSIQEITAPPPRFFLATNSQQIVSQNTKELDLSYCYVKNNVNMMDYVALGVSFLLPLILGPCIVAVFQVNLKINFLFI